MQLGSNLRIAVSMILLMNIATYKAVLLLQTALPSQLERVLFDDLFVLEDAIGRLILVHLRFVDSWQAFEAVLESRFRGIPGHDKIRRGEYVLQDRATGVEVSRKRHWDGAFVPKQTVDMSMVFESRTSHIDSLDTSHEQVIFDQSTCPGCKRIIAGPTDVDAVW